MRLAVLSLVITAMLPSLCRAQAPVFEVTPVTSTIKFGVKASVPITGNFDKWDATLTFPSNDVTTGVLDIQIQAASVDTGSSMKNNKLKSKDFFDVEQSPYITFKSTKVVQTGPTTYVGYGAYNNVETGCGTEPPPGTTIAGYSPAAPANCIPLPNRRRPAP